MEKKFTIEGVFKETADIIKKDFWGIVGKYSLVVVVAIAVNYIFPARRSLLGFLVEVVVSVLLSFFLSNIALSYARGHKLSLVEIAKKLSFESFSDFALVMILTLALFFVGYIFIIIPGLIVLSRVIFAKYVVLENDLSSWECVVKSDEMTKGNRYRIFAMMCLIGVSFVLSVVLFLVGTFSYLLILKVIAEVWIALTGLFSSLSFAVLYTKLSSSADQEAVIGDSDVVEVVEVDIIEEA